jgi:hypothetical protein
MSFAWVSGIDFNQIIEEVGHDGSEIIWPHLPEPLCRRGFHIQEMIVVMLRHGFAVIPIEAYPTSKPTEIATIFKIPFPQFADIFTQNEGVLVGLNVKGNGHALGWKCNQLYDPAGKIDGFDGFQIRTFFLITKIKAA